MPRPRPRKAGSLGPSPQAALRSPRSANASPTLSDRIPSSASEEMDTLPALVKKPSSPAVDKYKRLCDKSLGYFTKDHPARVFCLKVIKHPVFDNAILLLILVNACFQALIDYKNPQSARTLMVENSENIFLFLFVGEMTVKVISLGFVNAPGAYLRDPWSWLDFLVVVSGLLTFVLGLLASGEKPDSGLQTLRVFRVLRPLRSVSRLPGLKKIIQTFFLSVSRLMNVAAMFIFILVIFGILGINFLGGALYRFCRFTPEPLIFWDSNVSIADAIANGNMGLKPDVNAEDLTAFLNRAKNVFDINAGPEKMIAAEDIKFEMITKQPDGELTTPDNVRYRNIVNRLCPEGTLCRDELKKRKFFVLWPLDEGFRTETILDGIIPFGWSGTPSPFAPKLLITATARGCGGRTCPAISVKQPVFGVPKRRGKSKKGAAGAADASLEAPPQETFEPHRVLEYLYMKQNPTKGTHCGSLLAEDIEYGMLQGKDMQQFYTLLEGYQISSGQDLVEPSEAVTLHDMFNLDHSLDFNYGITHFNDLASASLTIFQSVTMSGWVDLMYLYEDCMNINFSRVFFIVIIILGTFFILNVTLAVVCDAFSNAQATGTGGDSPPQSPEAPEVLPKSGASADHQTEIQSSSGSDASDIVIDQEGIDVYGGHTKKEQARKVKQINSVLNAFASRLSRENSTPNRMAQSMPAFGVSLPPAPSAPFATLGSLPPPPTFGESMHNSQAQTTPSTTQYPMSLQTNSRYPASTHTTVVVEDAIDFDSGLSSRPGNSVGNESVSIIGDFGSAGQHQRGNPSKDSSGVSSSSGCGSVGTYGDFGIGVFDEESFARFQPTVPEPYFPLCSVSEACSEVELANTNRIGGQDIPDEGQIRISRGNSGTRGRRDLGASPMLSEGQHESPLSSMMTSSSCCSPAVKIRQEDSFYLSDSKLRRQQRSSERATPSRMQNSRYSPSSGVIAGASQACGSNCDPAYSPRHRRKPPRRVRFMPTYDHEFSDVSSAGNLTEGDHSRSEAEEPGGDGEGRSKTRRDKNGQIVKQVVTIAEEKKFKSKECCRSDCCTVSIVETESCFPGGGYICVVGCDGVSSGSSNGLEFQETMGLEEAMCESDTGEHSDEYEDSSSGPSMFSETDYLGETGEDGRPPQQYFPGDPRDPRRKASTADPNTGLTLALKSSSKTKRASLNPVVCTFTDQDIDLSEKTKSGLPRYRFIETVSMEATEDDLEKLEESAKGITFRIIRTSTEIGDIGRQDVKSRLSSASYVPVTNEIVKYERDTPHVADSAALYPGIEGSKKGVSEPRSAIPSFAPPKAHAPAGRSPAQGGRSIREGEGGPILFYDNLDSTDCHSARAPAHDKALERTDMLQKRLDSLESRLATLDKLENRLATLEEDRQSPTVSQIIATPDNERTLQGRDRRYSDIFPRDIRHSRRRDRDALSIDRRRSASSKNANRDIRAIEDRRSKSVGFSDDRDLVTIERPRCDGGRDDGVSNNHREDRQLQRRYSDRPDGRHQRSPTEGRHSMVLRSDSMDLAFVDQVGAGLGGQVNIDTIDTPQVGSRSIRVSPVSPGKSPFTSGRSLSSVSSGSKRVRKSSYIDRKTGDVITMIQYEDDSEQPSPGLSRQGTRVIATGEASRPVKTPGNKPAKSSNAFASLFGATGGNVPQVNAYGRIIREDLGSPMGDTIYNAFGRPIRPSSNPTVPMTKRVHSAPNLHRSRTSGPFASVVRVFSPNKDSPDKEAGGPKFVDDHEDGRPPSLMKKGSSIEMTKSMIIESTAKSREHVAEKNKQSRHQLVADLRLRPYNKWTDTRIRACELVEAWWFQYSIMLVIAANAVTLAMDDFPPRSKSARDAIGAMNFTFYIIFLIEAFFLHVAYGFGMYWCKLGTGFDGCILIISTLEMVMAGSGAFTAFRALRILKLAKQWKSFRMLMKSVMSTLAQIGNFVLLFLVVIYIFALLGQSFFATWYLFDPTTGVFLEECGPIDQLNENLDFCYNKCHQHDPFMPIPPGLQNSVPLNGVAERRNLYNCLSRANFDEFLWACLTVFHILSGDAWHLVMYDGVKAKGYGMSLYFVVAMSVGCFVVLNVFLAILISSFGEQQVQDKEKSERKNFARNRSAAAIQDLDKLIQLQNVSRFRRVVRMVTERAKVDKERSQALMKKAMVSSPAAFGRSKTDSNAIVNSKNDTSNKGSPSLPSPSEFSLSPVAPLGEVLQRENGNGGDDSGFLKKSTSQLSIDFQSFSLCRELFSSANNTKEKMTLIILHPIFDRIILLCICVSAVFIAIQNPLADPNTESYKLMNLGNLVFTIIFTIEMTVKMYCFGLMEFPPDNRHMLGVNIYQMGTGQKRFVNKPAYEKEEPTSPLNSEGVHQNTAFSPIIPSNIPASISQNNSRARNFPTPDGLVPEAAGDFGWLTSRNLNDYKDYESYKPPSNSASPRQGSLQGTPRVNEVGNAEGSPGTILRANGIQYVPRRGSNDKVVMSSGFNSPLQKSLDPGPDILEDWEGEHKNPNYEGGHQSFDRYQSKQSHQNWSKQTEDEIWHADESWSLENCEGMHVAEGPSAYSPASTVFSDSELLSDGAQKEILFDSSIDGSSDGRDIAMTRRSNRGINAPWNYNGNESKSSPNSHLQSAYCSASNMYSPSSGGSSFQWMKTVAIPIEFKNDGCGISIEYGRQHSHRTKHDKESKHRDTKNGKDGRMRNFDTVISHHENAFPDRSRKGSRNRSKSEKDRLASMRGSPGGMSLDGNVSMTSQNYSEGLHSLQHSEGLHSMDNKSDKLRREESQSSLQMIINGGKDAIFKTRDSITETLFATKTDQRVPYLKNPWNYLDILVVLVSWVDELTTRLEAADLSSQLQGFRILRLFRALRPLRLLSRNPSLRVVVDTILKVLPLLGNIVIITGIVFIVFSLWGMSNFKGAFFSCMNENLEPFEYLVFRPNESVILEPEQESPSTFDMFIDPNDYHFMTYYSTSSFDDGRPTTQSIDSRTGLTRYPLMKYRRTTTDTPVCIVHCRYGSKKRFCKNTEIWGYNVMKCSHCVREMCPETKAYFVEDFISEAQPILISREEDEEESRLLYHHEEEENWGDRRRPKKSKMRKKRRGRGGLLVVDEALEQRKLTSIPPISDMVSLNHFYETSGDSEFEKCYDNCAHDDYICKNSRGNYDCLKQCISQCLCSSHCDAFVEDAANCVEQGGKWIKSYQNFDSIFESATTLAEIATLQSFVDTMYVAIDARGPYKEPWRGHAEIWCLYFVLFVLVGSFFIMNLCVGMIIDNFNRVKKESGRGSLFLTESQESWVQCQKLLMSNSQFFLLVNMQRVRNSVTRRKIFVFVSGQRFEWVITSCIMLNTVMMCIKIIPEPVPYYNWWLEVIGYLFLVVFNFEFFLKFYAMEEAYFSLGWNQFDFICVLASDGGLVIAHFAGGSSVALASVLVLRVFRIARLFRLARFLKGLNKVFTAFVLSIPKLVNVGGLVCLLLFFYAIIGMYLFSKIRFFGNNVSVTVHNEFANFRSFWRSFITLFRCATGEGWNALMHNFAADEFWYRSLLELACETSMDISSNYNYYKEKGLVEEPIECGTNFSYLFFITFMFVVSLVILNLFIAVIFEAFDESAQSDESFSEVAEMCLNSWQEYDPHYTCFIDLEDAMVYIEKMILNLDIDQKFKQYAINMLERRPEDYDLKFAKALYLRMIQTPSGKKKVPAVACVLSILRFRIIHGKSADISKSQDVIKELESLNEEYYSDGLASMAKLAFEDEDASNSLEVEQPAGFFGRFRQRKRKIVQKIVKPDAGGVGIGDLIPLEQHIAATRLQRVLRKKLMELRELMDTPEYKERVRQREKDAAERKKREEDRKQAEDTKRAEEVLVNLTGKPLKGSPLKAASMFNRSLTSV